MIVSLLRRFKLNDSFHGWQYSKNFILLKEIPLGLYLPLGLLDNMKISIV